MNKDQAMPSSKIPGPRRWWILPVALVSAGPLAIFGPLLLRGEALYWGTPLLQFVPWRRLAFEQIRNGFLPLWNPLVGMGAPLLANHQSAILYPPNWLGAFLPPGVGETFLVLAHLVLAGIGMVAFLRRQGLGGLAQVVGGLSFAAGSYLVTRAGFPSLVAAASWLPWLLLASDRLALGSGRKGGHVVNVLMTGGVLAMMSLAGHAQTLVYAFALAIAWSAGRAERGFRGLAALAARWFAAAVFGFGLAAPQLLPTAEYFLLSSRGGGLDELSALTYSFWPWRVLGLLLPGLFGSPAAGDYWGYGNYWEDALYLGVLPLLMAVAGAVAAGRLGRSAGRARWFFLAAAALGLFFGLGANNPVFVFLFRNVPYFDIFNAPTRLNLLTTVSLSVLAGYGAELWRRPTGRGLYWSRLGTAGALAMVAVGLAAFLVPTSLRPSLGRSFLLAGIWLSVAGAASLAWPRQVGNGWLGLIAALIVLDLFVVHQGLIPAAPADLYLGTSQLSRRLGADHRVYLFSAAERELKFDRTHRFDAFPTTWSPRWIRESGLPNVLLLDGVPSANNFDPLVSARYSAWMETLNLVPPEERARLLGLMDVGWESDVVGESPPWTVYRPVAGSARVRIVGRAVGVAGPAEALEAVAAPGFDPAAQVMIETDGSEVDRRGGVGSAVLLEQPDPGKVIVQVDAPSGGWLVLSDSWYPGWKVEVDGESASALPADGAFRAVWLPAGARLVTWTYRPGSFNLGVILGVISLLAGGVGIWIARRRPG